MNLAEWRAQRAQDEEAQLPSGLTVRLRRGSVLDLAEQGRIPTTLQPQIDLFVKQASKFSGVEMVQRLSELINFCCQTAITDPVDLDVTELPFTDRMAIFNWMNEDANKLVSFRRGQAKPLAN